MSETIHLKRDEGIALIASAFSASGVEDSITNLVAQSLYDAERDGQKGHGFSRVPSYAAQARSGKVGGTAKVTVEKPRSALILVDAAGGFAYPALRAAEEALVPAAKECGIACAAIRNSHHCGQLSQVMERLADQGLVALMFANTPKAMAPWGGGSALFGTNPIAFGAPQDDAPSLVIDLSLSKVARGKIMAASKTGDPIPEGWALDADGNATTDAKAALGGTMIPLGDAKGAALALVVEVLAASLTGANLSRDASSFFDAEGPSPGVGQLIVAFDPTGFAPGFGDRIATIAQAIDADGDARLPGSRRLALREKADRDGVAVPKALIEEIRALA
ncbi:MAG: Ldh family oxidoreductase [Pseudomonadota bacterium]